MESNSHVGIVTPEQIEAWNPLYLEFNDRFGKLSTSHLALNYNFGMSLRELKLRVITDSALDSPWRTFLDEGYERRKILIHYRMVCYYLKVADFLPFGELIERNEVKLIARIPQPVVAQAAFSQVSSAVFWQALKAGIIHPAMKPKEIRKLDETQTEYDREPRPQAPQEIRMTISVPGANYQKCASRLGIDPKHREEVVRQAIDYTASAYRSDQPSV